MVKRFILQWHLGEQCNLKCLHCYQENHKYINLPYDDLISIYKQYKKLLNKLEALVEENPHYFYDILPYTYVLNISKKWINKFENIKMPEVDMGNFHYDSDSSFHSIFDNVTYPVAVSSSSGSSGCSSCGGGCSSCGGGCSSCGGGGSW